jgi:peptidoglycan/LPS O-acetylase OafA/YrhL
MVHDKNVPRKLQSIQVLRAVAAFLVVAFHACGEVLKHGWVVTFATSIGIYGEFGVDIFFVVSGFVMATATQNSTRSAEAAKRFILSRIGRIVPLYWAATTLFVALLLVAPRMFGAASFNLEHVISSYAFIPWRDPFGHPAPILNVGWTLNYEMWFYLVYTVLICVTMHRVIALSILFCATSFLCNFGLSNVVFQTYTSPIVLEFVFGAVIGSLYSRTFHLSAGSAVALFAIAAVGLAAYGGHVDNVNRFALFGIPAACFVASAVAFEGRLHWPKPMQMVGDASYSLYLTHVFTVPVTVKLFAAIDTHHRLPGSIVCATGILLSVIVGFACYEGLENPLGRLLKNRVGTRHVPVSTYEKTRESVP